MLVVDKPANFNEGGDVVNLDVIPGPVATMEEKFDVLKESRAAFDEISGIYGSGLGDHEAQILAAGLSIDDVTCAKSKGHYGKLSHESEKAKGTFTIEEGDEDEEDEEEDNVSSKKIIVPATRDFAATHESDDIAEFGAHWESNRETVHDSAAVGAAISGTSVTTEVLKVSYEDALRFFE